ncbi:MAG TPA: LPXTG cell wall anchor domain-containing protein [Acidimicrobiales bacterium]
MNKRSAALAGLSAATLLAMASPALADDGGTAHVRSATLTNHGCDATEWHFVINQVDGQRPASITIHFSNGAPVTVSLDNKSGVAHYTTKSHLGDGSQVVDATATLPAGTKIGNFNLSHGPCGPNGTQPVSDALATGLTDTGPALEQRSTSGAGTTSTNTSGSGSRVVTTSASDPSGEVGGVEEYGTTSSTPYITGTGSGLDQYDSEQVGGVYFESSQLQSGGNGAGGEATTHPVASLPSTGSEVMPLTVLGMALLMTGSLVKFIARRRPVA